MSDAPEAVFVVERRPGHGYGVTSAHGPAADRLQRAAVEVLDELGQPDPRGPDEVQRWMPAAGPDRQPVFVRIRRAADGESVYHQAWFPPAVKPPRPPLKPLPWLVAALVLWAAGVALGWTWRGPVEAPTPPVPPPSEERPKDAPPVVVRADAALQVPVRKARDARKKLADFLTQPGLTGWPDEPGTVERTVELRDFRRTPRGVKIEPVYLTGDEARALRALLDALDGVP